MGKPKTANAKKAAAKPAAKTATKPAVKGAAKLATKPAKPAAKPAASLPSVPTPPPVAGSQDAYDTYLPSATALAASAVVPFRTDASLAYHNVSTGVASLLARQADAEGLPGIDVASLSALPDQCLALAYAAGLALQANGGSNGAVATLFAQASALRRKLFNGADALVDAGLLPATNVAALHAGKGKLDAANDLVGLAGLFTKNAAAIRGKTAVTAAEVAQAAQLGSQLQAMLAPKGAKKQRSADAASAADVRDRMWTLVKQGHDALWRACAYLYGPEEIDARVPPLQSHAATTSNRKKGNAAKKASAGSASSGASAAKSAGAAGATPAS
ncbi:MAG TPA: hypothetical protein VIY73_25290 [Polyangiaceae bacterium]